MAAATAAAAGGGGEERVEMEIFGVQRF